VGDKIFLTCFTGYGVPGQARGDMNQLKLHLLCLNRDSGAILWTTDVVPKLPEQATIRDDHGYASSTPASDSERVYVFFGKTGVFAFDLAGKQLWQADVGSGLNGWGTATSPILFGDLVIVNASVESQSLVALDKKTGREVWRAKGIRDSWNTPVLVPLPGGKTELVVAIMGKVLGFDPASGRPLWSCANDITWYIVPSVVAHNGVVWSIGGRSGVAAVAVRAGGSGDVTQTHRLWTTQQGSNVSSPVIHEGHLYWMHENLGIAYCAEAMSGKVVYGERIDRAGQVYASPVLADGRLYYLSRAGRAIVLAARPKFERLAVNDLGDRSAFNASPAVTGNRLLVRSDRFLYCIGQK
jgi:outer membrane protein assembly factor BamB